MRPRTEPTAASAMKMTTGGHARPAFPFLAALGGSIVACAVRLAEALNLVSLGVIY